MINQSEQHIWHPDTNGTNNTEAKREPMILCRSQSCLRNVEEQYEQATKRFNNLTVIVMAIITSPVWIAYLKVLFDENVRDSDMPSRGVMITLCIVAIAVYILGRKAIAYIQNNINVYRNHCSNEVLIVDEEKVYGGNSKDKVSIPLAEIAATQYVAKTGPIPGEERLHLSNDIFVVKERNGKTHTFYTFSNCSELHAVIDMQIRRVTK